MLDTNYNNKHYKNKRRIVNFTAKLKNIVKKYKKSFSKSEYSFYVKQSIDTFGVHPFMCPYCKIMMDIQEIYVSSDWYGRTIHKVYF